MHNAMMLTVWLMRPNTVNPWFRRKMHLHHHKTSGTQQDLEERLVGNGIKNPLHRFIAIVDGLFGLIISQKRFKKEIAGFSFFKVFNAGFPIATCYFVILYSVVIIKACDLKKTSINIIANSYGWNYVDSMLCHVICLLGTFLSWQPLNILLVLQESLLLLNLPLYSVLAHYFLDTIKAICELI